jgi:hypothetical protein
MKRLHFPFFNLALISLSGVEQSQQVRAQIDAALQITREIFAKAGLGVGRVFRIAMSVANSPRRITTQDLVDRYGIDGDAIEIIFFQGSFGDSTVGRTPYRGDGFQVLLQPTFMWTGRTTAHELGHFLIGTSALTSRHKNNPLNLMAQSSGAAGFWVSGTWLPDLIQGAYLDYTQVRLIREKIWVKKSCFPLTVDESEPSWIAESPPDEESTEENPEFRSSTREGSDEGASATKQSPES